MNKINLTIPKYTVKKTMQTFSEVYDWGLRDLNIPEIHKKTQGEGIVVAVLDSGKSDHFETSDAILGSINYSESPYLNDHNGHSCVHPESYIWTSNGFENIESFYENIKKPEMVFQEIEDMTTKNINNLSIQCYSFNSEIKLLELDSIEYIHKTRVVDDILKIHFGKNCHVKLTKDHPAYTINTDNEVSIKPAEELKVGDNLICNHEISQHYHSDDNVLVSYGSYLECDNCKHKIRIIKPHNGKRKCKKCHKDKFTHKVHEREMDTEWSYLVGLILANGHIDYCSKCRVIKIYNTDENIINQANNIFVRKGFNPFIYIDKRNTKFKTLYVRNKELCEFFIEIGIQFGNKTKTYVVPKLIQSAPSDIVLSFLAGFIDGDGSISEDSRVRIATDSHVFAQQFTYWLLSRGIRAQYDLVNNVDNHKINEQDIKVNSSCHITLNNLVAISKYMASSKRDNLQPDQAGRKTIKITKISVESFDGYFYDLTMKKNANYQANGVIVSNTACSGLIAARKNNEGIIGVAPKCKLYFGKAMDDAGRGNPSALVNCINWAISKKVDIISISAGMFFDFKPLKKMIQKAYQNNIIIVAAVGNSSNRYYDVAFPARYPEVIGVAAYDQKHKTAPFSSRGANVSFALPGVDIYSTYLNNGFAKLNGTSFSCPIMAGICALILSKHRQILSSTPCDTPAQMMEHLVKYAKKLGSKNETGFGTLNLDKLFSND